MTHGQTHDVCSSQKMIKRIAAISVSLMLSVVIVALGAGVSFVRCCHMQTVVMAQLSGAGHHDVEAGSDEECCGHHDRGHGDSLEVSAPDCMKVTVVRLAPTVAGELQQAVVHTPCPAVMTVGAIPGLRSLPVFITTTARIMTGVPHSPPRDYLRMIRVLLI